MDAEIKTILQSLTEKIDSLVDAIQGTKGLLIRVDRIEQTELRRKDLTLRLDRIEQKESGREDLMTRLVYLERRAKFQNKVMWTIGSGCILAIIGAAATIFIN